MKNNVKWDYYEFRSSQCSKLLTGDLPNKEQYKNRINELQNEKDTLKNKNGNKVKWTEVKNKELLKLLEKEKTPFFKLLPKTITNELRKIHRSEKFGRNFSFTNKYVQKGISQEDEAITIYQRYRNKVLGINTFFINNKKRISNGYITGEADITDTNDFENCNEGFDTKCSWELETFPYIEDDLDFQYEVQDQCYMWLSNCNKWTTAYVLVNITEHLLNNEKMKWFYAFNQPMNEDDLNYDKYIKKLKELEVRYIFDYDDFVNKNPGHIMEITRDEWFENDYDIPLENRVIEKVCYRNDNLINELKERIKLSREYLKYLDKHL